MHGGINYYVPHRGENFGREADTLQSPRKGKFHVSTGSVIYFYTQACYLYTQEDYVSLTAKPNRLRAIVKITFLSEKSIPKTSSLLG